MIENHMTPLPDDIDALQALVRQLLEENAALQAELAELKARLSSDSQTSHKPPSSDGYRKRPALPKPPGRKKGGQPGHHGNTLTMVSHPDHTTRCQPAMCSCGASLLQVPGTVMERRQVFELPVPTLEVTEYQRIQCRCPACGAQHDGVFPAHVTAPTQYGVGVHTFATLLNTSYLLPFKKIRRLFADLFGYALNESTSVRATTTCYEALAPSEAVLQAQVLASPVAHVDETGIRVAGRLHWQHVMSTASTTYLFVHAKRGTQALDSPQSLLPSYHGWAVHDCWPSYFSYSACRHALCGAHLLRELTAVAEQGRRWATLMHHFLLTLYHASEKGTRTAQWPQRWSRLYDKLCLLAQREEPPPVRRHRQGRATRSKGRNLLERLIAHKRAVLAFAWHAEVPFTNNQAERDLRPVKVKQKISGSFRTLRGAQHYARIQSFISTARKRRRHVFKELLNVFLGKSFLLQSVDAK
jgi:transposase